jgi:hypothetical protein
MLSEDEVIRKRKKMIAILEVQKDEPEQHSRNEDDCSRKEFDAIQEENEDDA